MGPFQSFPPTKGVGWKLLQQVGTPSFPGAGLMGRRQEKGQRRWLPTSHWAAVYTQAMSWLLASRPAPLARCAGEAGWLLLGSSRHSMLWLNLGTKRESCGRTTLDPCLAPDVGFLPVSDFSLGPTATPMRLRNCRSSCKGCWWNQDTFGLERTVPWKSGW